MATSPERVREPSGLSRTSTTTSSRPPLPTRGSTLTLSDGALRRLQQGLKECRLPASLQAHLEFIPRSELQRLVEENVAEILHERSIAAGDEIPRFSKTICRAAPKLFAILVEVKKERHIIEFVSEGIDDDCLPFLQASSSCSSCPALVTSQNKEIQTLQSWDIKSINKLKSKQYRVLSPVFREGEHYELDELHILPFVKQETEAEYKPAAAGGYGEVSRECIHPAHHKFETPIPGDKMVVAVKRMFRDEDYTLESKVYRELGRSRHTNLINLLFTFKSDKYHLVFPWADGTLKDYWEKNSVPALNRNLLLWSVKQMAGIASGLSFFHEFTNPAHGRTRFGRHGDIKAQNVLWFRAENVLKIADLGLASVRGRDSRSNIHPNTVTESPTYSPPEKQRRHLVSRKWDIWSLGCLYLEFITYLVLGNAAIEQFSRKREDASSEIPELLSDEFYSPDYETVKPSVVSWVAHLKQHPHCSSLMHNILDLVMSKMILVDPGSRGTSAEICEELEKMLEHAEKNDGYLLERNPGV